MGKLQETKGNLHHKISNLQYTMGKLHHKMGNLQWTMGKLHQKMGNLQQKAPVTGKFICVNKSIVRISRTSLFLTKV